MHLNLLTLFLSPLALALPNNHLTTTNMNPTMTTNPKLLSTNQTLGHAIVHNTCIYPIYLWTVSSTISPQFTLQPNTTYSERYRRDPSSGGIALKLTRVPNGLYGSAPQMIFAYNLVGGQIWYDLSDVFGDPFRGERVEVEYEVEGGRGGDKGQGAGIEWVNGVPTGGSMVRVAEAQGDIILTVC